MRLFLINMAEFRQDFLDYSEFGLYRMHSLWTISAAICFVSHSNICLDYLGCICFRLSLSYFIWIISTSFGFDYHSYISFGLY
jgi:hypothetical protein